MYSSPISNAGALCLWRVTFCLFPSVLCPQFVPRERQSTEEKTGSGTQLFVFCELRHLVLLQWLCVCAYVRHTCDCPCQSVKHPNITPAKLFWVQTPQPVLQNCQYGGKVSYKMHLLDWIVFCPYVGACMLLAGTAFKIDDRRSSQAVSLKTAGFSDIDSILQDNMPKLQHLVEVE